MTITLNLQSITLFFLRTFCVLNLAGLIINVPLLQEAIPEGTSENLLAGTFSFYAVTLLLTAFPSFMSLYGLRYVDNRLVKFIFFFALVSFMFYNETFQWCNALSLLQ